MRILSLAVALLSGAVLAAATASGAPDSCAALGGVVTGGDCHVQASDPAYKMEMTFPLDYLDEQAIVDYLRQTRDGFVNVANDPDARNQPLEMDVTAESLRSAQTRSVVLKLFQDVGSAHPTTWYRSFTYDTARGKPVTFDTLFAPGTKPLDVIFPIVQRELETETQLAGSISPGDGRDPTHYQNFAVTDDSVIFYFGQAELLPSHAGETSVTVPRSALPPLAL
ncbi:MAG: esterase [Mycobacteriaceae bacterium]